MYAGVFSIHERKKQSDSFLENKGLDDSKDHYNFERLHQEVGYVSSIYLFWDRTPVGYYSLGEKLKMSRKDTTNKSFLISFLVLVG